MTTKDSLLCRQANQLDLVDYLSSLNHSPTKVRGNDYWYLSPLRSENTASFKVHRKLNVWYDHGTGKGGTLVDFGILYFKCTVKDLLFRLRDKQQQDASFQQPVIPAAVENKNTEDTSSKIKIISSQEMSDARLFNYLHQRKIPVSIAKEFCEEICFEIYDKKQLAIGFKNDNGGYELRSSNFKGSSSPKAPKLVKETDAKELIVFEGFFDFLSFQTLLKSTQANKLDLPKIQTDFLVLNSISFFEKQRQTIEQYSSIHLFFDRDKTGVNATSLALQWSNKYKDQSHFYKDSKDLNDWLIKSQKQEIKQSLRLGRGL